jgi:hypothetical protein
LKVQVAAHARRIAWVALGCKGWGISGIFGGQPLSSHDDCVWRAALEDQDHARPAAFNGSDVVVDPAAVERYGATADQPTVRAQ